MTDDRVKDLGGHDRAFGLFVDSFKETRQSLTREKEAVSLVIGAVDRHPDVVEQGAARDHDFGVAGAHAVIGDHGRLHPALDQEPRKTKRDVEDDLHVDP